MSDEIEHNAGKDGPGALASRVAAEVARRCAEPLDPGLYLAATPIGNLADVTLRVLAVLARADVICCEDTRHSRTLLAHYGIDRPLRAYHEHNAEAERPDLIRQLKAGRRIALISDAGTPLISDPGYKLVRDCVAEGIAVVALPGASAVLAALTVSGLPTDAFHFAGFLPAKSSQRRTRLDELSRLPATLIVFESPGRLADTLAEMASSFGERNVVVARELTKRFEEIKRGTAAELSAWAAAGDVRGEIVLLVAPPLARETTEAEIEAELTERLADMSLKEASRQVADRLGVPRSRAYELGLALKKRAEE